MNFCGLCGSEIKDVHMLCRCGAYLCENCEGMRCEECSGEIPDTLDEAMFLKGPTKAEQAEQDVLEFMREKGGPVTPLIVGQRVAGRQKKDASSWGNRVLKRLMMKSRVGKTSGGTYYIVDR